MRKKHMIEVNENVCIGCGLCKEDCPANNIIINNKKAIIKTQDCIKCDHCAAICPKKAIKLTGFDEEAIEFEKQVTLNSNELLMSLKSRRSIRKFKDKKIPIEVIQQIIEAGRFTPTAKNAQDISYIILDKNKNESEEIAVKFFKKIKPIIGLFMKSAKEVEIDEDFFFKKAPIVILVLTKDKISGSLAASNMSLMAESCGLGVLYSGFFTVVANNSSKLKKLLNLNKNDNVVTTLVIGYSDVKYRRTAQKEKVEVRYL